jgi:hypothetical protein
VSKETLTKLARFDSPTICNVIELFDIRPRNRGYMDGRIKSSFPELPPIVGFACTAAFRSDAPPAGGAERLIRRAHHFAEYGCCRRVVEVLKHDDRRQQPYSAK